MIKDVKKESFHSNQKVTTLADLLSPEELEELSKLSSNPPSKRTSLKFSKKDFEYVLPLDPRHKSGGYRVLKTIVKTSNISELQNALLWNAIYGNKSLRLFDWMVMFNYLIHNLVDDKPSLALMAILRITAGGKPSDCKSIESSLYSVRQIASNYLGKKLSLKFCQRIQQLLGVKLPTSVRPLDELIGATIRTKVPKKSPEPARIGVGYKDKGTLSNSPKLEPIEGDWIEPTEDCFLLLLEKSSNCRAFDSSFDKMKRKKLLSKLINSLKD